MVSVFFPSDDCGVVAVKVLDVWHPRAQLQNIFSSNDILNIRIKLANEIYFSKHNQVDKTVVSEFFGDVCNTCFLMEFFCPSILSIRCFKQTQQVLYFFVVILVFFIRRLVSSKMDSTSSLMNDRGSRDFQERRIYFSFLFLL
jgi:hypothetical protein